MVEEQKQDVHIMDNKGAPPELVRLAQEAGSKCSKVKVVVFDAFIEDLKGELGAYDPDTGSIIVDMGACITDKRWMKKGIMFIPNVWFNLIFTFFHEMAHAFQLEEDPSLALLEALPLVYEEEADTIAENSLINWVETHDTPLLAEMSWVGEQIKDLFNKMYAQVPEVVVEELDINGTPAASNALHAVLAKGQIDDEGDRDKLLKSIDDGEIGVKINGKRYFTAYEAVNTTQEAH